MKKLKWVKKDGSLFSDNFEISDNQFSKFKLKLLYNGQYLCPFNDISNAKKVAQILANDGFTEK